MKKSFKFFPTAWEVFWLFFLSAHIFFRLDERLGIVSWPYIRDHIGRWSQFNWIGVEKDPPFKELITSKNQTPCLSSVFMGVPPSSQVILSATNKLIFGNRFALPPTSWFTKPRDRVLSRASAPFDAGSHLGHQFVEHKLYLYIVLWSYDMKSLTRSCDIMYSL